MTTDNDIAYETLCREVAAKFPGKVADYRAGRYSLLGLFVGHAMKESKHVADPNKLLNAMKKVLEPIEKKSLTIMEQYVIVEGKEFMDYTGKYVFNSISALGSFIEGFIEQKYSTEDEGTLALKNCMKWLISAHGERFKEWPEYEYLQRVVENYDNRNKS